MQLPSRSTLVGGLAAVATWGIGLGLTAAGIALPVLSIPVAGVAIALTQSQEIGLAVAVVGAIANHFTPDSIKTIAAGLNTDVERLGKVLPYLSYAQSDFPGPTRGPQSPSQAPKTNNFNQG